MKVQVRDLLLLAKNLISMSSFVLFYYVRSLLLEGNSYVRTKHMNPSFNNVLRKHNVDIADNVLKCFSYEGLGVHGALTSESCRVIFVINCFRRYALILNT